MVVAITVQDIEIHKKHAKDCKYCQFLHESMNKIIERDMEKWDAENNKDKDIFEKGE